MTTRTAQGQFSIVRWVPNLGREEFRNIGVILADQRGECVGARWLPANRFLSRRAATRGIILLWQDALEAELKSRCNLCELAERHHGTLDITPPRPIAIPSADPSGILDVLYSSYIRPSGRRFRRSVLGSRSFSTNSRPAVIRRIAEYLASNHPEWSTHVRYPVGGWHFDVVSRHADSIRLVVGVLLFNAPRFAAVRTEDALGKFLWGVSKLTLSHVARACLTPPSAEASDEVRKAYQQARAALQGENIRFGTPDDLFAGRL